MSAEGGDPTHLARDVVSDSDVARVSDGGGREPVYRLPVILAPATADPFPLAGSVLEQVLPYLSWQFEPP